MTKNKELEVEKMQDGTFIASNASSGFGTKANPFDLNDDELFTARNEFAPSLTPLDRRHIFSNPSLSLTSVACNYRGIILIHERRVIRMKAFSTSFIGLAIVAIKIIVASPRRLTTRLLSFGGRHDTKRTACSYEDINYVRRYAKMSKEQRNSATIPLRSTFKAQNARN